MLCKTYNINNLKSMSFYSPKEIEEAKSRDSPTQWISETSHVEHPNIKNIDKFLQKYKKTMLFFYISGDLLLLVRITF